MMGAMILLSIETSCDETAISVLKVAGDFPDAEYQIIGNALFSQVDIHKEFGGVFPTVAKREHINTIVPMLKKALDEAGLDLEKRSLSDTQKDYLKELLIREDTLAATLIDFSDRHGLPKIDYISVTCGPGLEPALWVGVNFAKALAYLSDAKVIASDHMEGHILASVFIDNKIAPVAFPALALLVSGGHTELILMTAWGEYTKVGQTRDDAVGEAFDKVARMLDLPYPGGPEIGRLAKMARSENLPEYVKLPQPMVNSGDLDFSFSGLKTAVRYAIADKKLSDAEKQALARDFEDAATAVLIKKSIKAIEKFTAKSFILGGGVSANTKLRADTANLNRNDLFPDLHIYIPDVKLSTDNSIMIALAGHARLEEAMSPNDFISQIKADGNKSL